MIAFLEFAIYLPKILLQGNLKKTISFDNQNHEKRNSKIIQA